MNLSGVRTNWNDALLMTLDQQFVELGGDRIGAANMVVFIADGPSTVNYDVTDQIVETFLASDQIDRVSYSSGLMCVYHLVHSSR